jgi:predicted DNA-binding transcriptional regulator AlpA
MNHTKTASVSSVQSNSSATNLKIPGRILGKKVDHSSLISETAGLTSFTTADVQSKGINLPQFYRLPTVLDVLQMSRAKFLKMVKDGDAPPPIKCGRCSLYVAEEINIFAKAMILKSRGARPFDIRELLARMG